MNTAFSGLSFGLLGAIVLIYLLIVVNFQSWLDPFVIITALPAALAGIVWMLFATGTTLSVPALTGAIMCMGVATANSILVVSFARERLAATGDAALAAVEAGFTRFRPVLMTALAMIIGMAPMALGLGEGGEQNAPLGRAVIGGLIFATVATLMFVPVVFSIVHGRKAERAARAARRRRDPEKPMPDDPRPADATSAARASASSIGIVAACVAVADRGHRPRQPRAWRATTVDDLDRRATRFPTVSVISLNASTTGAQPGAARQRPGVQQRADLCARQRLSEEVVRRHRTPVKAGQLLAEIDMPDQDQQLAQAKADLGHRDRQPEASRTDRQALERLLAKDRRRLAAGRRREERRPRRQDRGGRGRAGQRRPAAATGELQAHHRAVRRRRHQPRHRHRRADHRRRAPGTTPLFTVADDSQAAHLCERAAELFGPDHAGHEGHLHRAGISRPDLHRDAGRDRRKRSSARPARCWSSCRPTTPTTV